MTLRAGAELDARRVNQYTLLLRAACPREEEVTGWLFVWVLAGQVLRCDAPFASAGGDVVRVPADVAPRAPLHAVLPQPLGGLTVSARSSRPLSPASGSHPWGWLCAVPLQFRLRTEGTPLTLTPRGLVLAPTSGFSPSRDTQVGTSIPVLSRHRHLPRRHCLQLLASSSHAPRAL